MQYSNPCQAFCNQDFVLEYGACGTPPPSTADTPTHCDSATLSNFAIPMDARLTRTSFYRIGVRIEVASVEDCAEGCLTIGNACQSFEFHPANVS
jgi:hypothetical protein